MSPLPKIKSRFAEIAASRFAVAFLLLLGGMLVYFPALNGELLWDDLYLVGENPFFKSPVFVLEVFKHYLYLDSISLYYRPVQNLAYIFDYWMWRGTPFGYHFDNAIFHSLSGILLYELLRRLLPKLAPRDASDGRSGNAVMAFGVAAIWVVHPIHNAAVAYVAGRADSLATIFAIGAWLFYLRSENSRHAVIWYACAAMGLLMALCAKEIAFIWIALFTVFLFAFDRKSKVPRISAVAVVLTILGVYLALRAWPADRPVTQAAPSSAFSERVILMLRALGDYVSLIFWPQDLHMDRIIYTVNTYKGPEVWHHALRFEYLSLIGFVALCGAAYMSINKRPGQRLRVFGLLWFLLGFLPISNLFPLNAQVAEHWIYMPSMGLFLFLAASISAAPEKWRTGLAVLAFTCLVPLGMRTAARSYEWADAERFYKQTIAAGGGTPRVHLNLALIYTRRGDHSAAEKILREAVERFPDYATARINLGICLVKEGKNDEAEKYLSYDKEQSQTLAKTYPHTWSAALNVAKLRYEANDRDEALRILDGAMKLHPEIWDLVAFKAQILQDLSNLPEAISLVQSYSTTNWWHYGAHLTLGRLALKHGETERALAAFADASTLDIYSTEPLNFTARACLELKRPEKAYDAELKAIRRNPDQPSQYLMLSTILDELHRPDEAKAALERAQELADSAKARGA